MKGIVTYGLIALVGLSQAAESGKNSKEAIEKRKAAFVQRTGGFIKRPNTGKGKIVFVNTQDRIADAEFAQVAKGLSDHLRLDIQVVHAAPETLSTASASLKRENADVGVVIVSWEAADPSLLVLPDRRCAIVNVAGFPDDKAVTLARKQTIRGFAAACGAMSSQSSVSLMGTFDNDKQLAAFPGENIPGDVVMRMKNYLQSRDVLSYQLVTYRTACQQGWAPAPTNDVQKAIWNEVHTLPKTPMKIEFDQKKGR